jgi:hypothetical protein
MIQIRWWHLVLMMFGFLLIFGGGLLCYVDMKTKPVVPPYHSSYADPYYNELEKINNNLNSINQSLEDIKPKTKRAYELIK